MSGAARWCRDMSTHLMNCQTVFPQWLHHFTSPLAMYEGWASSTSLPTLAVICLFDYSHPSGCEAESHCGFDLHFLHDGWCRASFPVLTTTCLSSSENCLLSVSARFWIGLFVFLLFCWLFCCFVFAFLLLLFGVFVHFVAWDEPGMHQIAQAGLEHMHLLSLLPEFWSSRHTLLCLICLSW